MSNTEGQDIKELITKEFNNLDYKVEYKILNAADYGIPQQRKRVIFMISKNYPLTYPKAKYNLQNYVTVGDALGNIPIFGQKYLSPKTTYQKLMKGNKNSLYFL